MKFVSQLRPSPREPRAAALAGGTTSGMSTKGIGPRPMLNEATKDIMEMLAMIGELLIVSAKTRDDVAMRVVDRRRSGRRPRRCRRDA